MSSDGCYLRPNRGHQKPIASVALIGSMRSLHWQRRVTCVGRHTSLPLEPDRSTSALTGGPWEQSMTGLCSLETGSERTCGRELAALGLSMNQDSS